MTPVPLFGIPMGPELVVILLIAILLFGANKIPKLARSTGQALGEFEKGKTQAEQELKEIKRGGTVDTDVDADTSSSSSTDTDFEPASPESESNE